MKTPELKPCPFCGGEAKITNITSEDLSDYYAITYQIYCESCYIGFKDTSYFGFSEGVPFISVDGYKAIIDK